MSVIIPFPFTEVEEAQVLPSKSYRLDFERGRIFSAGSVDGLEAVEQFIKKELLTPRFKCLIYDNQRGSEIKEAIIAKDATKEFAETEIPRMVRDTLRIDDRIFDVFQFSFTFGRGEVHVGFRVDTIFGETDIEVVI